MRTPILVAASCLLISCASSDKEKSTTAPEKTLDSLKFITEKANDWNDLFTRKSGWFGGDGIFALTLNGKESENSASTDEALIWFSDTMIGEIDNNNKIQSSVMVNNTVALLRGGKPDSSKIRFYWDANNLGKPASVFIPNTPATEDKNYYWLGDGFVNHGRSNNIHIFGYRIENIPGQAVFGFREAGNTLITIPSGDLPPFPSKKQVDIPFYLNQPDDSYGSLGAAVMVNTKEAGAPFPDGFVYVYGIRRNNKEVYVARVTPANVENFDTWEFYNGRTWTKDALSAAALVDGSSNEMSVTPLVDGRYMMVFMRPNFSTKVGIRLGASPIGPWGPTIDVYDAREDIAGRANYFTYNAKAFPIFSKPGELLISYNVNSFDFFADLAKDPNLYRPRFIRLKYELD